MSGSKVIEYIISAKDKTAEAIESAISRLKEMVGKVDQQMDAVDNATEKAMNSVADNVADSVREVVQQMDAVDNATEKAMDAMADNVAESVGNVERDMSNVNRATSKAMDASADKVDDFSKSVKSDLNDVRQETTNTANVSDKNIRKFGAAFNHAIGNVKSFSARVIQNLANIKAGLDMVSGVVQRFAGVFATAIKEAFKFEKATSDFKVLLGNVDKAKEHIADLRRFASSTPLTFDDLSSASKLLPPRRGSIRGSGRPKGGTARPR